MPSLGREEDRMSLPTPTHSFAPDRLRRRRSLQCLVLVALVSTAGGCSLNLNADRVQCRSNDDCSSRGDAFSGTVCVDSVCVNDPKWSCLDEPPASASGAGPFTVKMQTIDLIKRMPLAGVHVSLCRKVDVDCAQPVMTADTDAQGAVTLTVEAAFSGFASFQADGSVPTLYFFNPPVDHDQVIPPLSLSTNESRGALLDQLGAETDRADILLTVQDCLGKPASGVQFTITPPQSDAITYYLVNGLPTAGSNATDASGYGGFMNLSANTVTVKATLAGSKRELGTLGLVVRGGAATWSRFAFAAP